MTQGKPRWTSSLAKASATPFSSASAVKHQKSMMKLIKRIGCLFGRHYRSKGLARDDGSTRVSVCSYCGVRMRQLPTRAWVVEPRNKAVAKPN